MSPDDCFEQPTPVMLKRCESSGTPNKICRNSSSRRAVSKAKEYVGEKELFQHKSC